MLKMVLEQACARCFSVKKPSENPYILLQNINLSKKIVFTTSFLHYDVNVVITFNTFFHYDYDYLPPHFKAFYKTLVLRAKMHNTAHNTLNVARGRRRYTQLT